jgi:ABC-2 type transport system ATP-binding protein
MKPRRICILCSVYKSLLGKGQLKMSENIIEVNNLDHSYGDFKAVDDVCFSVKEGEIFSFLGPNGAGKSTVINILITLLPLQHGSVRIAGFDLATQPEQVRKSIGIVFLDEPTIGLDTQTHMRLWEYWG